MTLIRQNEDQVLTVINTNAGALMAKTYAVKANERMQVSMERLSSGLRINSAADDAAGLAVGNKMASSIKSYEMGARNSADIINLLATAENSLSQILDMQLRIRELAVQSANGIYTDQDRDTLEIESLNLIREMDRLATDTKFNGLRLLDGSFQGKIAQTGAGIGDHVSLNINELSSSSLGRFWETTTFTNGRFDTSTPLTSPSADVSAIPGWEIHNKRVELGQDGSNGPANINNRDNVSISNTIAGFSIPEDPTPRPFNNAVPNLVVEPNSSTTSDTALTYGVTHTGIIDPSPPDALDPGTYDVTVGALSSVTISSSTTTGNAALMNQTFTNVTGSAPAAGGTNAQFTVSVGEMTITPTSSTTSNAAMMGQTSTNVAGSGGSGTGALFNVTVGEMTTTPSSSTTTNTNMMGQTFTNVEASAPSGGGTKAKFTVSIGQMKFNETSGNSTANGELFSTNYANIAATTLTGGGSGATFNISINSSGNIEATAVNFGSGYNVGDQLKISGASIGGGSDLILTIGAADVSITQTDAGSGYARNESITILGSDIGGDADGTDDIALTVGDANVSISLANAGTGYAAGDVITIPGELINGTALTDDISVTVGDANISVSVTNAGSGYKVGEQITISGSQLGATDGADNIVVNGNAANVSVTATAGSDYTTGGTVTLTGSDLATGAANLGIKTLKVPPGTEDSARPLGFGTLGDDSETWLQH
jgi:flagellin